MIHFIVSRSAEARPLIDRYGLEERAGGPFPLFANRHTALAVSGPGKMATAAATGWLFQACGAERDGAWLHVGMAGHAETEIGSGLLAHKVTDQGSGRSWYPAIMLEHPAPSTTVITVDQLDREYEGEALYDTEASGFLSAAERFATIELVHAYRVVVDNHGATLGDNFADDVVEDLVESKVSILDGWVEELREMSEVARRWRHGGGGGGDGTRGAGRAA